MSPPILIQNLPRFRRAGKPRAFSLIEVIIVVALMSVIILGLLLMFGQVQRAYKLGTTQVDVLESGRAVADMLSRELGQMTPSRDSNCVNFYAGLANRPPLLQDLSGTPVSRTNLLGDLFFLTKDNQRWTGIGYFVSDTNATGMGTLYRYETNAPYGQNPAVLYQSYLTAPLSGMSRMVDGVVHFRARAYDTNGFWITYTNANPVWPKQTLVGWPPTGNLAGVGEVQIYAMTNNAVPAMVDVELGILEDAVLAKVRAYPTALARHNYLTNQVGATHLFRIHVPIRNVDPTVYQ